VVVLNAKKGLIRESEILLTEKKNLSVSNPKNDCSGNSTRKYSTPLRTLKIFEKIGLFEYHFKCNCALALELL